MKVLHCTAVFSDLIATLARRSSSAERVSSGRQMENVTARPAKEDHGYHGDPGPTGRMEHNPGILAKAMQETASCLAGGRSLKLASALVVSAFFVDPAAGASFFATGSVSASGFSNNQTRDPFTIDSFSFSFDLVDPSDPSLNVALGNVDTFVTSAPLTVGSTTYTAANTTFAAVGNSASPSFGVAIGGPPNAGGISGPGDWFASFFLDGVGSFPDVGETVILPAFVVTTQPGSTITRGSSSVISGSVSITQIAPIPLPAGLPLLLAGLGTFAVLKRRRTDYTEALSGKTEGCRHVSEPTGAK